MAICAAVFETIAAAALKLLSEIYDENSIYVFPSDRYDGHLVGIQKAWERVRKRAGMPGLRLHDLRHSFASMGVAGGLSLPLIGALLGHKHAATTARYAHLSADPLRAANELIGLRVAAAMKPTSNPDGLSAKKIVRMPAQPRRAS